MEYTFRGWTLSRKKHTSLCTIFSWRSDMKVFWTPSWVLLCLLFGAIDSMGQGIRVESAFYGSRDGVGIDVTGRIQRFADYGEPFRVSNETLRIDPAPNRPKILKVTYYVDGRRISETVPEGEVFYFRN